MIDHGIHIAGGYKESQPRLSEHPDALWISPVRLGDDAYPVSSRLQETAYDGMSKGRMVHVRITDHIGEIDLVSSSLFHISPAVGEKSVIHSLTPHFS